MQSLDVGEIATLTTQWWDKDDQPAEPSAIDLVFTSPSGATNAVTKAGMQGSGSPVLDTWSYGQVGSEAGLWRYDLSGTVDGALVEKPSGRFLVGVAARDGPCEPWCSWDEVTACGGSALDALLPAQREACIDFASELLWNLSGRVYSGICETTRSLCFACYTCGSMIGCGCEPLNGIDLGAWAPVWAVWDVLVENLPVAPVKVVNRRYLFRTDGGGWPSGWNVHDTGAFRASWAYGRRVPSGGRRVAALFAAEVARTCPPATCSLPDGTTAIAAEGVTYSIDPSVFERGHTGMALVDEWLEADRRGRISPPRMYHPHAGSVRRLPL